MDYRKQPPGQHRQRSWTPRSPYCGSAAYYHPVSFHHYAWYPDIVREMSWADKHIATSKSSKIQHKINWHCTRSIRGDSTLLLMLGLRPTIVLSLRGLSTWSTKGKCLHFCWISLKSLRYCLVFIQCAWTYGLLVPHGGGAGKRIPRNACTLWPQGQGK